MKSITINNCLLINVSRCLTIILTFVFLSKISGQDISYLQSMPSVEAVNKHFKTEKNKLHNAVKRYVTFEVLQYVVIQIANERTKKGFTLDEKKIAGSYLKAQSGVYNSYFKTKSGHKVREWEILKAKINSDDKFVEQIFELFVRQKAKLFFEKANRFAEHRIYLALTRASLVQAQAKKDLLAVIIVSGIFFLFSMRLIYKSHYLTKNVNEYDTVVKRKKFKLAQIYLNWGFRIGIISFILFGFSLAYFLSRF